MPRKPSQQLTEAELRLMNVLWDRGQGSVGEVAEALDANPPLAYNTILTTLRILEAKGYVRHTKESRAFIYEPLVGRDEASTGALRQLLARFFDNSPELLVANLLKDEKLRKRDLDRLRRLIGENK
jgi:BlaI family transcriptional regulator, penicillinase repressor